MAGAERQRQDEPGEVEWTRELPGQVSQDVPIKHQLSAS